MVVDIVSVKGGEVNGFSEMKREKRWWVGKKMGKWGI